MTDTFDPHYETTRVTDADGLFRKLLAKRRLFPLIGEPYIGRRAKLAHFKRWLTRWMNGKTERILEIGSGEGVFSFTAAQAMPQATVIGLEINQAEAVACQKLAEYQRTTNLSFCSENLKSQRFQKHFDLIFCLDVFEHVHDDTELASEIGRCLRDGGSLLAHVPSRYWLDLNGQMQTVTDEEAWRINPGHVRNGYTPDEFKTMLTRAGFRNVEVVPASGRPIAKAYALFAKTEFSKLTRILALPLLDHWIRQDLKTQPAHGNTLWAVASSYKEHGDNE